MEFREWKIEKEKREITLKDVFKYGINEIREKIERNKEMDIEIRREAVFEIFQTKKEIENFSKENPQRFREILEKIKEWKLKVPVVRIDLQFRNMNEELIRDWFKYRLVSEMIKFEKTHPSERIRKLAEKILSLNGIFSSEALEELDRLNLTEKEIEIIERIIKIEKALPSIEDFEVDLIRNLRENNLTKDTKEIVQILSNEEKFKEVEEKIKKIENELQKLGLNLWVYWGEIKEIGKEEVQKEILSKAPIIKDICKVYNLPYILNYSSDFNFIKWIDNEKKEKILSEEMRQIIKDFKIELLECLALKDIYKTFCENKEGIFFKKKEEIKKILSDFGIKKISWYKLEDLFGDGKLSEKEIDEISKGNLSDFFQKIERIKDLIENSSFYKEISFQILENIRKTKGDYQARTFPSSLIKYLSLNLTFDYLLFKNPSEEILEKLKRKAETSEIHRKIYNKILSNVLELKDIIPGKKATKKLLERENIEYLTVASQIELPFDYYGIVEKDLKEIKKKIDERGEELIENYSENKEKYLPYLGSLLGYAAIYKEEINEILKIKNLWEFKFSHLKDLNSILENIKNLKMEIEGREKENIEIYIKNLEEHMKAEGFGKAKERIWKIKEKNRKRALELIEKTKEIIKLLREGKIPEKREIETLFSNKFIFEHLGLSLTLESIKQLYQKITQEKEEKEELKFVEILKTPQEILSAINIEPSCMRVNGEFNYGALGVTLAPILVLGVKDNFGKIKGRSLLIPVKDKKGKWKFELKNTYGVGERYIEDFAKQIERVLKEKKKDYYEKDEEILSKKLIEGTLPKSKKLPSVEKVKFWRDGKGEIELETIEGQEENLF